VKIKVTLQPTMRGTESLSPEELFALLKPGAELVLGEDGIWDVERPDEPE